MRSKANVTVVQMRALALCFLGGIATLLEGQPPAISQNGVVNAASRIPSSLTDGAIARGAVFSILGVRLGAETSNTHLELGSRGRSITIAVRSVQPRQIQALLPKSAPLGPATLSVTTPDGTSKPFAVRVVTAAPGLFSVNRRGWGQGQVQILESTGGRKLNGIESPIRRGGKAVIDATGLAVSHRATVVVGGIPVQAQGMDHASLGVDRIRFEVPHDAPQGCFVPVYVRAGSSPPSNVVTMAIQDGGASCRWSAALPLPESRIGLISISRLDALYSDSSPLTTLERAVAAFFESGSLNQTPNPLFLVAPEGTCTAYYGDSRSGMAIATGFGDAFARSTQGRGLSAGRSLSIAGSGGVRVIPTSPGKPGAYEVRLGLEEAGRPPAPPLFLNDPKFTVSADGLDIGSFMREIPGPPALEWMNRRELAVIDRSKGATFEWRGAPKDAKVLILAVSVNSARSAGGFCLCSAKATSGRFTVPAEMLANLPSSEPVPGPPVNMVFVISERVTNDSPVPIRGLDQMWEYSTYATGRRVSYR